MTTASRPGEPRLDGHSFVAVRTTGIYCRPICPAGPPRPENISWLPSAAAAQARGYRPCRRCRPELAPDFGPRHPDPLIARAMAALEHGTPEASLPAQLATDRATLDAAFARHLGATPGEVVSTRRFLLARQLVTDTTLTLPQVAEAAGYGDLAAMDAAFRADDRRPLAAIRRRGPATLHVLLPFKPPYDWAAIIRFLAARSIAGVEQVGENRYERSIGLGGVHGTVAVAPHPSGRALEAEIRLPALSSLPAIIARLRRIFDLATDPDAIAATFGGDAILGRHVAARPGLRIPGAWDGFELAVRAILGQQITVAGARTLAGKLAATCGSPIAAGPLTTVFPTPAQMRGRDLAALLGMPRSRGAALAGLADRADAAELFLPGPDLSVAVQRLKALPGIGEWTAHYIALRAFGLSDAFPAADLGLLRAMDTGAGRPTPRALMAHADRWRPWRGYAAQHLWSADAARSPAPRPRLMPDRLVQDEAEVQG